MNLHEQGLVRQFTSVGVEEWFLSLDSYGVALASSWRRLRSELRPGGAIRDIEQGLRRVAPELEQVQLELVVERLRQRDAALPRPRCPKCLQLIGPDGGGRAHPAVCSGPLLDGQSTPRRSQCPFAGGTDGAVGLSDFAP